MIKMENDSNEDVFIIKTPEKEAKITEKSICVKGSEEVCNLITPKQRDFLLDNAMWLGYNVKRKE